MSKRKIKVGILFGGRSAEHEVSLASARNIAKAIDKRKYEIVLIGIDKTGKWIAAMSPKFLLSADNPRLLDFKAPKKSAKTLADISGDDSLARKEINYQSVGSVDVVFPVLHGPYGEDGTIQGLLKLANIPYVGSDVLGSALGMDKDAQKRLLQAAGIPVARFIVIKRGESLAKHKRGIIDKLKLPLFVKPANLGSSVGVSKVKKADVFEKACREAFRYDNKILIEECIKGREIECSVLGNEDPIASVPGEVIPQHEFYSYEAKYLDEHGALLRIPAALTKRQIRTVQQLAVGAFQTLCCEGMARVDMFLTKRGKFLINEINTIPGFTDISMYPKLWEESGIPQPELIDRLIKLALARFARDKKLKTSYD